MVINNIRRASTEEVERYWPGNGGRWNCIVEGSEVFALNAPFDLKEVISGERARRYANRMPYNKVERKIKIWMRSISAWACQHGFAQRDLTK